MRNAACVRQGRADIVDQLLLDQLLAIPDAVENFADGDRRDRMLANQPEAGLVFRGRGVFHPEQAIRLDRFAETRGFDRRQAVVDVMQQMRIEAEFVAHGFEEFRHEVEILFRRPALLLDRTLGSRLVHAAAFRHAVHRAHIRHAALNANGLIAGFDVFRVTVERFGNVAAGGVAVHHHAFARGAAEQLVQRHARYLAENVPQRHIHCGDRRHRDRTAAPVRAFVEVLPGVFDATRIAADQQRAHVVFQIRSDREFAAVQRCIADAVYAFVRDDFQCDEIAARAGDDHIGANDLHDFFLAEASRGPRTTAAYDWLFFMSILSAG